MGELELGAFAKSRSEGFASPVQFPADGIGGLMRDFSHLFIAQFLICDEEQQGSIFVGKPIQCFLDALTQFRHIDLAKRAIRDPGRLFKYQFIRLCMDVSCVPTRAEIGTMVQGNPVKPSSHFGFTTKSTHISPSLDEDVMGSVLGRTGISQHPQAEVKNWFFMRLVEGGEFGGKNFANLISCHRRRADRCERTLRQLFGGSLF